MFRPALLRGNRLPDDAYVELVRSLFAAPLPSVVMSVLFAGVTILGTWATSDRPIVALGVAGTILSAVRLSIVFSVCRAGVTHAIRDKSTARIEERRFGLSYLAFAGVLGLFAMRTMALDHTGLHMVVSALVVGYAAGVAAIAALRPWIGMASILVAVLPTALSSIVRLETFHLALGIILLALTVGGLQSMVARYRAEIAKIELRRSISSLARRDHLTGLINRLGLIEGYAAAGARQPDDCLLAIHCLDLDRFKPVNDLHGHPVGDELLRHVAGRLTRATRHQDLVARVGGDEFIVLQGGLRSPDEADALAARLSSALSEPYRVGDVELRIGVSVGYVVSHCDEPLDALVARADNALYAIKGTGGGAAAHSDVAVGKVNVVGL